MPCGSLASGLRRAFLLGFRLSVSLDQSAFPRESMSYDSREIVEAGLPAEYRAYPFARRNDAIGIARSPWCAVDLEIDSRHALYHRNHFAHREAVPIAAIESQ